MDAVSLVRLRWRLRGAWMWPTFVVCVVLDGVIGHWLPISGDSESPVAGWLLGMFLSLVGVAVLGPILGIGLRRLRPELPKVVARDYAGTAVIVAVTLTLLSAGALHQRSIAADHHALQDATARAEAFIGDRAPLAFRLNLGSASVYELQPPEIYRVCVQNRAHTRSYCVVVDRRRPFKASVSFSGYESNALLSEGT